MKRTSLEIKLDILKLLYENRNKKTNKICKTNILYKCNLSNNELNKYLNFLLNKDYIQLVQTKERDYYLITSEGIVILNDCLNSISRLEVLK